MAAPVVPITSVTISGDWENPQIVGSYIDCTGLTIVCHLDDSYAPTVEFYGSDMFHGELYSGGITVTASPAQFQNVGTQEVVFTATNSYPSSASATKSVNVISTESAEKIIINAELYEEI